MWHKVRTAAGILEGAIKWDEVVNHGGIGQGNGAGPQSYHSQLLPQVEAYEAMTDQGLRFSNPDGTLNFFQWLIGFVDDNTILLMLKDPSFASSKIEELLEETKRCIDVWQRLVVIAGGEIEIKKSCIAIMSWVLQKGTEMMATVEEAPGTFKLQSLTNPEVFKDLTRLAIEVGERILGVRLALKGNDDDEYDFRLKQAKGLATKISTSPFTRTDAEIIYNERWIPSIGYCLPVTQFTHDQCNKIMVPFYASLLPKMGFNRHIPLAIRYGPKKYNGKGLTHLYTHQFLQHLIRFIGNLRCNDRVGLISRIQMDKYQLYVGSQQHFLLLRSEDYPYGEQSRIQFLWEECTKRGITIHVPGAWTEQLGRENDLFLMDRIVKVVRNPVHLRRINAVRLFLKVSRLSDIVNKDGNKILPWALQGIPNQNSKLDWPPRPTPLPENLKLWREALYKAVGAAAGLYPANLGPPLTLERVQSNDGKDEIVERVNVSLQQLSVGERALLGEFNLTSEMIRNFMQWNAEGTIYVGTDGSVQDGKGAHSFAFTSGERETSWWGGSATTPGNSDEMASQRAEHAGSIAAVLILIALHEIIGINQTVVLWIDNAEVIRRKEVRTNNLQWKETIALDYDLWALSERLTEGLTFPLRWEKVDSHVDRKRMEDPTKQFNGNELAWRINEVADRLAEERRLMKENVAEQLFPEAVVMVKYQGSFIYGDIYENVTEGEHGPALRVYLMEKFHWSVETFDSINWDAMKSFVKNLDGTRETNIIKLLMNWQNDAHQNDIFYGKGGQCPACSKQEHHLHFLSCQDPVLYKLNTGSVNKLERALRKTNTAGTIARVIREVIGALRHNRDPVKPEWKPDKM